MPQMTPARIVWKIYWRQLRILRRETKKQFEDVIVYGMGVIWVNPVIYDHECISVGDYFKEGMINELRR